MRQGTEPAIPGTRQTSQRGHRPTSPQVSQVLSEGIGSLQLPLQFFVMKGELTSRWLFHSRRMSLRDRPPLLSLSCWVKISSNFSCAHIRGDLHTVCKEPSTFHINMHCHERLDPGRISLPSLAHLKWPLVTSAGPRDKTGRKPTST